MNDTSVRQVISPDKVCEGVYILDMFEKEQASIRPETVHGDTHAQSTTIFGLAHFNYDIRVVTSKKKSAGFVASETQKKAKAKSKKKKSARQMKLFS